MKYLYTSCILSLLFTSCGRDLSRLKDNNTFTVNEDSATDSTISFSYLKPYRLRGDAFRSSQDQTKRCHEIAAEHQASTGIAVEADSLKVLLAGPEKNCLHRNELKGCDKYEYIYTITCQYNLAH